MQTQKAQTIPRRHGSDAESWQFLINRIKPFIGKRALPDKVLCDAYGEGLLRGDAPMDELLEWMTEQGMRETRPLFMRALEQGIDSIEDAPEPLKKFFTIIETPPPWLDYDLMDQGADAYATMGEDVFYSARDFILMGGYLSSSINEVLARAGGLERGANRRMAETADWYFKTVTPGGMTRFGEGFKATIHVRFVHALVRRRITNLPDWDVDEHGIAVNQTDMIGTWLGGSFGAIVGAFLLGRFTLSPGDFKAALHLFKYSHWLMGVEEEFLSDEPADCAHRLANLVLMQPGPTEVCIKMAHALAEQPMDMHFGRFQGLRRRMRRYSHLSRNRYFLGRRGIERLGLSAPVLPWLQLARLGPNAVTSLARRFVLPGQREALVRRGRAKQAQLLAEVYGNEKREINPEAVGAAS